MLIYLLTALCLGHFPVVGADSPGSRPVAWDAPPTAQTEGHFWRFHRYDREQTPLNPGATRRLRINSPNATLHPNFGQRGEAKENGLVLINAPEDLFRIRAAEFCVELWGGHPGTANKRVSINGRAIHPLPEVGTATGHCTYSYPAVPLQLSDLVNGWNACQLALDQGESFWGHAMIDAACLRVALTAEHPDLTAAGLAGFDARPEVVALQGDRGFSLRLDVPEPYAGKIRQVHYQGWYEGFDENGNGASRDWHGFTRHGRPAAWLGSAAVSPFAFDWDTTMLPAQSGVSVRAMVEFQGLPDLVFLTAASRAVAINHPNGIAVTMITATELPVPFWSRAGNPRHCVLELPVSPDRIERADLQVVTWTGGAGSVKEYFQLNDVPYPVAEGSAHEPRHVRLPVSAENLREGANRVELLSDTEHHGIEIMLPGPALLVRFEVQASRQ
jgi:hypothetical protein